MMFYRKRQTGFTLIELVITVTVLSILTLGVIPLVQISIKRQKEEQLRAALRAMREAIDQFHREALIGASMQALQQQQQSQMTTAQQEQAARTAQAQAQQNMFGDPRVRVFITDQTIFGVDNPDRYPPDLDTLVKGVDVLPLTSGTLGRRGVMGVSATEATAEEAPIPKTKIYLRQIPIDPMTGKDEWDFRSCYDSSDATSWGGENVFDVHSKSKDTALDGTKYSDG